MSRRTYYSFSHNVAPRYTCGSPALVNEETARRVAQEEARMYGAAMTGLYGAEDKDKAERLGLTGIVWVTTEHRRQRDFHDCITAECGIIKDGVKLYQAVIDDHGTRLVESCPAAALKGLKRDPLIVEPAPAPSYTRGWDQGAVTVLDPYGKLVLTFASHLWSDHPTVNTVVDALNAQVNL